MKATPDYIYQLMTEKLAAIISAADEQYLDDLIDNDPVVREKWDHLRQTCMPEGREKVLERLNTWPEDTARLIAGKRPTRDERLGTGEHTFIGERPAIGERSAAPNRKYRLARLYKIAGAAAAVVLLAIAGWLLFKGSPGSDHTSPALVFRPGSTDHIRLELASGKTVDLSGRQGLISTEGAELTNEGDALTYRPSAPVSGINTLTVPAGASYSITIADGTKVWLNSMSVLKFPLEFTGNSREISIEGEAYLKVAENKSNPFIVHLPNSNVLVTGTEFNINTYNPDAERVALVNGSVYLSAANATTILTPGTQAVYNTRSGWSKTSFDTDEVLGWRQGLYYFYDTTLEDISGTLTRWFGITVVIDHPAIRDRRFAGVLDKNQSIHVFLKNIKAVAGINYYFTDEEQELHFSEK